MRRTLLLLALACNPGDAPTVPPLSTSDADGDGCLDKRDPSPFIAGSDCLNCLVIRDPDGDGLCNDEDLDDDGDGCPDRDDDAPLLAGEDLDGDGLADICDLDDDGDGCIDAIDPNPNQWDGDSDGDGIADVCEREFAVVPLAPRVVRGLFRTPTGHQVLGDATVPSIQWTLDGIVEGRHLPRDSELPLQRYPCDLDGDGWDEYVVGLGVRDGRTHGALYDLDLSLPLAEVVCADFDADGEAQFAGATAGSLVVFDEQGQPLETYPRAGSVSLAVAQLDEDAAWELVGEQIHDVTDPEPGERVPSPRRVADDDGDGVMEWVSCDGDGAVHSRLGQLQQNCEDVLFGDLDGDGAVETLVATGRRWSIYDRHGSRLSRVEAPASCGELWALEDDGDGQHEILCGLRQEHQTWDPWTGLAIPKKGQGRANRSTLVDLDGDGTLEMFWVDSSRTQAVLRTLDGDWLDGLSAQWSLTLVDTELGPRIGIDGALVDWHPVQGWGEPRQLLPWSATRMDILDVEDGFATVLVRSDGSTLAWLDLETGFFDTLLVVGEPFQMDLDSPVELASFNGVYRLYDSDGSWLFGPVQFDFRYDSYAFSSGSASQVIWRDGTRGPRLNTGYLSEPLWLGEESVWFDKDGILHGVYPDHVEKMAPLEDVVDVEEEAGRLWVSGLSALLLYEVAGPP